MKSAFATIAVEAGNLAADFPKELIEQLASAVEKMDRGNWAYSKAKIVGSVPQPAFQSHVGRLLNIWESSASEITAQSVCLALLTAAEVEEVRRHREKTELVWTGPDSQVIPLRRTDEALLQLIREAKSTLIVVSFAVYKVGTIAQALVEAARRGVKVSICLETADASEGKIAYDTIRAIGAEVARHASFYIWPLDQRSQSAAGDYGSLHAKVAVADDAGLLISSANLTEYAMMLNMEMGVLIHGGPLPGQAREHFNRLIQNMVLERVA